MAKKGSEHPIKKFAKTIDAAFRDAGRARDAHTSPQFRKDVQKDRRGTLRKFDTVEHALEDRAKIEKAKAAKSRKK
jgi:hypothetical protein